MILASPPSTIDHPIPFIVKALTIPSSKLISLESQVTSRYTGHFRDKEADTSIVLENFR